MSPSRPIRKKMMASRMWPPVMLPNRRRERDRGRARWLMISMGTMRGASQTTGPMKCRR
jgi:hypothetical protein